MKLSSKIFFTCCIITAFILFIIILLFIFSPSEFPPLAKNEKLEMLLVSENDYDISRGLYLLLKNDSVNKIQYLPLIIQNLKKNDDGIKCNALQVIVKIGKNAKVAIPLVLEIFENDQENMNVRAIAASALIQIGDDSDRIISSLIKIGDSCNQNELRNSIIRSLGMLDKDMFGVSLFIKKYVNDKDMNLRIASRNALSSITKDSYWKSKPTQDYISVESLVSEKIENNK